MPTMTHEQANEIIGQSALLTFRNMKVKVIVRDLREAYSRIDALVHPVAGSGYNWVALYSLELLGKEGKTK